MSAAAQFLSAQCTVLPAVCEALDIPSVELLIGRRPDLDQKLQMAKAKSIEKGASLQAIPQPSSATDTRRGRAKGRACIKSMQRATREEVESQVMDSQGGRLRGQGRRGASLWLQQPLPEGEAPANATWSVMVRQRLLMPAPGSPHVPQGPVQCRHCNHQGRRCEAGVDDDGVHEGLCSIGGGVLTRHNRVRDWLAEKLRCAFGGRTLTEQPHRHANGISMGRIDLKHDSSQGHLDIDVTITSIYTSNVRESLRRRTAPERSIRAGVKDKLRTYGAGVLAFAADDTGAISVSAVRLLRKMAHQIGGVHYGSKLLQNWRAELQHIILQSTTGMAQVARGEPRTA